ncbi:hypothetical protein SCRES3_gp41 [Synechococcus phage S-CRES3]|nr:hypothetical protein SCRES3_gp41 [Synechococcus phage S-CRES3]
MEKLLKASQLLSNWLNDPTRFDLYDVADRGGILAEVCFLSRELKALLDDETNIVEMYEFFLEDQEASKPQPTSWLGYLTSLFGR